MSIDPNEAVESTETLVKYYRSINREEKLYTGIELERSGVYRDSLEPVKYDGENGYLAIFEKLADEVGWEVNERDQDMVYEMQRGETRITTEADGRPELTGSPQINLHDLSREFRLHDNELREIGNVFNIAWLPVGIQPLAPNDDIQYVPKKRYKIFTDLDETSWMHTWLKRMNGMHVNISYTTEENAMRKAQTAFRIMPVVAAMFANSPFDEGTLTGYLNTRRKIAKDSTLCTQGIPSTILDDDFSYEKWIECYMNIPVIYAKNSEGEPVTPEPKMTFAQWMQRGWEGKKPTIEDFDQHVKTIWSDIRLRPSYLEMRVADSVPYPLAMSCAALYKGLLMDSSNWDAVAELTKDWTYEDVLDADARAWKTGLQTEVHGRTLLTYAQELITLSNEKLHLFERTDAADDDESIYLTPLKEQIFIKEKSPAEELVSLYEGEWDGNLNRILEWCESE